MLEASLPQTGQSGAFVLSLSNLPPDDQVHRRPARDVLLHSVA